MESPDTFLLKFFAARNAVFQRQQKELEQFQKEFCQGALIYDKRLSGYQEERILEVANHEATAEITTNGNTKGKVSARLRYQLIAADGVWLMSDLGFECPICHATGKSRCSGPACSSQNTAEEQASDMCKACKGAGWIFLKRGIEGLSGEQEAFNNARVDYQLDHEDLVVIAKERGRQPSSNSLLSLYYCGILPVLGVGLALAIESFATAAVFTVLFVASSWFVQDRIRRAYIRNVDSEDNLPFSMRRWSAIFTDEGIRFSSNASELLFRWAFIRQVFRGPRFLQIEFTPVRKIHIPIRAFRDETHIEIFTSEAQSHIKKTAL